MNKAKYCNIKIETVDDNGNVISSDSISMTTKNVMLGHQLLEVIKAQKALDMYKCAKCKLQCNKSKQR